MNQLPTLSGSVPNTFCAGLQAQALRDVGWFHLTGSLLLNSDDDDDDDDDEDGGFDRRQSPRLLSVSSFTSFSLR